MIKIQILTTKLSQKKCEERTYFADNTSGRITTTTRVIIITPIEETRKFTGSFHFIAMMFLARWFWTSEPHDSVIPSLSVNR